MGVFVSLRAPGLHCPVCAADMPTDRWQSKFMFDGAGRIEHMCQYIDVTPDLAGEMGEECRSYGQYIDLIIYNGRVVAWHTLGSWRREVEEWRKRIEAEKNKTRNCAACGCIIVPNKTAYVSWFYDGDYHKLMCKLCRRREEESTEEGREMIAMWDQMHKDFARIRRDQKRTGRQGGYIREAGGPVLYGPAVVEQEDDGEID